MHIKDMIQVFEKLSPPMLAEEWDNPGLLIEPEHTDIRRILVALDCTPAVVREAEEKGAQLVLTHHPLFFKPVRRIHYSAPDTAAAYMLIRRGIGLYAAHTNLDSAVDGVNDALAHALGLTDIRPLLMPERPLTPETAGLGRIGTLKSAQPLKEFAIHAREALHTAVRYGGRDRFVSRVAVIGGSGGGFLHEAKAAGADVLLTGEVKHDMALDADVLDIGIIEAGHYETESVVLLPWIAGLQAAFEALQYTVDLITAQSGCSPLIAP